MGIRILPVSGGKALAQAFRSSIDFVDSITAAPRCLAPLSLLRVAIASTCIINTLLLLPFFNEFFGPAVYFDRRFLPNIWLDWILNLSCHPNMIAYSHVFIALQLFSLICVLLGRYLVFAMPLAYLTTMNVWALCAVTMDGGNNLVKICFLMLLLCNCSGKQLVSRFEILTIISNALTNCIFRLIQIQIVFVYFCAAIYKFHGELWNNGMALYYTLQVPQYSVPIVTNFVLENPMISSFMTHGTLLFQYLFPVLIFVGRTRKIMLLLGVGLHLGIFFIMGLGMFALHVIATYTIFLNQKECIAINNKLLNLGNLK